MALTSLLGDIVKVVRGKGPGRVKIDNKVFQLHYRLTTFLFLGFSILVTAYNMLGEPVSCACAQCGATSIPLNVMNSHCWVTATYTVPSDLQKDGFSSGSTNLGPDRGRHEDRNYQTYYQWVPFMLVLHGVLFYVPHWLWTLSEDGRMAAMVQDIRLPVLDRGVLKARVTNLAVYIRQTMGTYQGYFIRFVICDALNVINVIATIYCIDKFLGHKFLDYGNKVVQYLSEGGEFSPFTTTFPKQAKCEMEFFGPTGSRASVDGLCVLALNVLNEKVYLVLWFWLIFLAVLSSVVFAGRLVLMLVRAFRVPMLQHKAHFKFGKDMARGVNSLQVGDFFLLSLMARNMDVTAFRLLLKELAQEEFRRSCSDMDDEEEESDEEVQPMKMRRRNGARSNGTCDE